MMRTTPFAPFIDNNHQAIFKMTLIEEIAHSYKSASNFQVWFLEHTRLRQSIDREAIPRLFRWGSVLDKKQSFSIDSLQGQQIIKHLKLATKKKTVITCVSQEKIHVQTEGVTAPPHPALMGLLQGLRDEIRLLPERLQQSTSSNEAQFEALTTVVTMGFDKIEKLISSTSMAQDQPTFGTDAENFFSTPPSLTHAPAAPAYDDANAFVLIVDQEIIAPDLVNECKAPASGAISLLELDQEQLHCLLEFLYRGSLPEEHAGRHAYALLLAADKYDIPFLRKFHERHVLGSLSPANALDVLERFRRNTPLCVEITRVLLRRGKAENKAAAQWEEKAQGPR
ncbi:hypothetical protein Taro_024024 [Colocasia esculenta]|uniref:BTB domain-containing protein n=1 Tax=Colocasia esculenta TaxID=4460 RepID=A0A843VCI1_COLES|nr:hypothetical protein [Colocasia esculenta]